MNKEKIKDFIGNHTISIVDTMERIDKNAKGILFIVGDNEELVGCVTDGDIRRWIIKNGSLNGLASDVMNKTPISLQIEQKLNAKEIMNEKSITAIPITNINNEIVDIICENKHKSAKSETSRLKDVPVVIMAGGKGTRLYPYTKILPKPLIPIGDTPIIERIMEQFKEQGSKKFYISVNYKKEMIRAYFNEIMNEFDIVFIEEDRPLGTGGSVKLINDKIKEPFFVTNCDAMILSDYEDIYDYHIKSRNSITMVTAMKNITIPYGVIRLGKDGTIDGMEEKPKVSHLINTGMYVINPETIDLIPNNQVFHMTDLVEKVIESGGRVGTYPISEDSFLDMGEFAEMKRMEQKLNLENEW